jgi:hypothetical protein
MNPVFLSISRDFPQALSPIKAWNNSLGKAFYRSKPFWEPKRLRSIKISLQVFIIRVNRKHGAARSWFRRDMSYLDKFGPLFYENPYLRGKK